MHAVPGTSAFYHTVERGQTLYRIAKTYGVDWHELMRANGISDVSKLETGQRLLIPGHGMPSMPPLAGGVYTAEQVRRLVGPRDARSTWRTITVHHSGTLQGGAASFNRNHLRRRMGGLFYHFVIGNGSQSRQGQIEVGWRWKRHVKANRPYDIQICLVGDFNRQSVSEEQFASLVALIQTLRADYGIPVENVRRHDDIPGKHTACPGSHFPFSRLLSTLRQTASS
jgi:LysM repeat protein